MKVLLQNYRIECTTRLFQPRFESTYERLVDKAGVEIWLNSRAIEVNMHSAGRIESLTVASISGITVCRGKVFIDCTGSAEIAGRAGVSFQRWGEKRYGRSGF